MNKTTFVKNTISGLNSFWGKFGQRTNLTKTEYVNTTAKLTSILADPTLETVFVEIICKNTVAVQYKKIDDYEEDVPNSNTIIAGMVTAYGRLKIYEYLDKLGKNALYCDTDSVIFLARPGSYVPPTGDYLGDMTDELGGDTIETFVSTGPKSYAFRTTTGKQIIRMKGFVLVFCLNTKIYG